MLLALALIPPWQQPDEPSHVALVELQRNRIALLDGSPDPAREADVLKSMAEYDWWQHRDRGFPVPATIPERFAGAGLRVAVDVVSISRPPMYFLITGRLFSWMPKLSVVEDLYMLRALSAVFGMLTLWVAWLGARECLGERGGATVAVLLALHPQFAIVSTAATPDAMVNFLGACAWWQTAVAVRRKRFVLAITAAAAAALAAASADRMGLPLVPAVLFASVVVMLLRIRSGNWKAPFAFAITAILAAAMVALLMLGIDAFGATYALRDKLAGAWAPVPQAMTWDFFSRFTLFLHQSWWLSLGWVRYPPPAWWAGIAMVLTAMAAIGAGRRVFLDPAIDARTRVLLGLAAMSVAVQVAAVYWTYFRLANGAQGKSLFPVLVPCLVLLWVGLEVWIPRSRRVHAAAVLVLLFALLDAAAWTLVAIPAYSATF